VVSANRGLPATLASNAELTSTLVKKSAFSQVTIWLLLLLSC
jgi:hypothetical protein